MINERAGTPARDSDLVDVPQLITAYYALQPDPADVDQRVSFGTSGHRGSSLRTSFNELHILATTQAIVEYRAAQGTTGPLFLARDTHGLSEPAWTSATGESGSMVKDPITRSFSALGKTSRNWLTLDSEPPSTRRWQPLLSQKASVASAISFRFRMTTASPRLAVLGVIPPRMPATPEAPPCLVRRTSSPRVPVASTSSPR